MLTTRFSEACPSVATHDSVDVDALTAGDSDPMFVTLRVAEVGAVSQPPNRLLYDDYLVAQIEQQGVGVDALMGHLPQMQADSAFPIDDQSPTPLAGVWVGFRRVENTLWGKAYIPPRNERVREYIRQVKAVRGELRTSIYGKGQYADAGDGIRRLSQFVLETIDFAPPKRAALPLAGDFAVTAETQQTQQDEEEDTVTTRDETPRTVTLAEVPDDVREQILREANYSGMESRVAELEQVNASLTEQVEEMRQNANIVAELRTTLGEDADVLAVVQQMHAALTGLVESLGVDGFADVSIRVNEIHEQVQQMQTETFNRAVNEAVEELTADWHVTRDEHRARLNALHNQVRMTALAQMGNAHDVEQVAETVQSVWMSDDIQAIAEAVRDSLSGPAAIVSPTVDKTPGKMSEDQLRELGSRFVAGKR